MSDIVDRLGRVAQAEREVAMDADMRPEDTINGKYADTCDEAAAEITRLRAENERLREALKHIAAIYHVRIDDVRGNLWEHQRIALAALKETDK